MERISFQNAPKGLYDGMFQLGKTLKNSGIEYSLLELMKYRVGQINGCAYCLDMHFKEAIHAGISELKLSSVSAWREAPFFSDQEKVVLAYAEALTVVSANDIEDEIYLPLKDHFSEDEIAHLTLAIVEINGWSRFMKAFKITPGEYKVGMYE